MKSVYSVVILLAGFGAWGCSSNETDNGNTTAGGTTSAPGGGANVGGSTAIGGAGGVTNGVGGSSTTSSTVDVTVASPVDGTAWTTECANTTENYYVARGGGVADDAVGVRVSVRQSAKFDGYGTVQMGFRCVTTGTPDTSVAEWASIPAGTFTMGCSAGDAQCADNEKPAHSVTISTAFSIMKKEVTNAMYWGPTSTLPTMAIRDVAYTDAAAYCEKVGGRLPTEAEWEYAARAGTTGALPCSGCTLDSIAWFADNVTAQNTIDQTDPYSPTSGGQKAANAWGIFDMLGNVPEWTQDCYHNSFGG